MIFHPEVFKIALHLEGQRGSARKAFERARQELTFHQFDDAGRGGDAGNMPVKASAVAQPGWGDDLRVAMVVRACVNLEESLRVYCVLRTAGRSGCRLVQC